MLKQSFGTDTHGREAHLYTLANANGTQLKVTTLGAAVVSFFLRVKKKKKSDIVNGEEQTEK